jgi:hypothetical protein
LKTATELSVLLDKEVSHDKITRYLSSGELSSKTLWLYVKPIYKQVASEDEDGVLIIDDSVVEKKYTDRNEIINWHYSHTECRHIKGVNFMSCIYHTPKINLPVMIEFVRKDKKIVDKETGEVKYKSSKSKNEMFREMVAQCVRNGIKFQYILCDSWFSSAENMEHIVKECGRHFIMEIKDNRLVALNEAEKHAGRFVNIKSVAVEGVPLKVYVKQLNFPLLITKQVFKNEDGSMGYRYLASDDLNLTYWQMTTIYHKRWKVEEYHQSLKNYAAFGKSPTKTVQTQISHFIASVLSYVKLEALRIRTQFNHHALKMKIILRANQAAFKELQKLSTIETAAFVNFA